MSDWMSGRQPIAPGRLFAIEQASPFDAGDRCTEFPLGDTGFEGCVPHRTGEYLSRIVVAHNGHGNRHRDQRILLRITQVVTSVEHG